jgi:hypothetical protein
MEPFYKAVISGQEIHFVGYGFVDDVDLIVTAKSSTESFHTIIEQMQGSLDTWSGGIRVNGWQHSPNQVLLVPHRLHLEAWQCLICYCGTVSWGAAYG